MTGEQLVAAFIRGEITEALLKQAFSELEELWHTSDNSGELFEFLGLTQREYQQYVVDPNVLPALLYGRPKESNQVNVASIDIELNQRRARYHGCSVFSIVTAERLKLISGSSEFFPEPCALWVFVPVEWTRLPKYRDSIEHQVVMEILNYEGSLYPRNLNTLYVCPGAVIPQLHPNSKCEGLVYSSTVYPIGSVEL
jgi:hypothetical protein